ncbi:MAG TPA: sel1 repeat family protein [Rhodanobacteraceae bacterium]|nr:sel1 repeat family protein [Rhodanobacteraceae bacterium]
MKKQCALLVSALTGAVALAMASSAQAQTTRAGGEIAPPDYRSCIETCAYTENFNSPEADGRPGVKFYYQGMKAYKDKDYAHAIYMLKVAASWAYKPAEYNLGIMYFKGMGVPVNRPLGTAWMFLAAERNTPHYVYARHLMVSDLDYAERTKAYDLLQGLEKTYGDKVALHRAEQQWALTKSSMTGSRLGYTGNYLMVGSGNGARAPALYGKDAALPTATGVPVAVNGWAIFKNGDVKDGSIAYQQFQKSDNPYSPIFVNNRTGVVNVEPLQTIKSENGKPSASSKKPPTPQQRQSQPPASA